jgi:hypothetical protein
VKNYRVKKTLPTSAEFYICKGEVKNKLHFASAGFRSVEVKEPTKARAGSYKKRLVIHKAVFIFSREQNLWYNNST